MSSVIASATIELETDRAEVLIWSDGKISLVSADEDCIKISSEMLDQMVKATRDLCADGRVIENTEPARKETHGPFNLIKVWSFFDAPYQYQCMSDNGGDEDWIAWVPQSIIDRDGVPEWLQENTPFAKCILVERDNVNGGRIFIGCHS